MRVSGDMPLADIAPATSRPVLAERPTARRSGVRSLFQQVCQCLAVVAVAMCSYFIISRFFLASVCVVGQSMEPTLQNSQHFLLNRWVYYVRAPRRGDIVVIRDPADHKLSVKRIVALTGDTVFLKDGCVRVNGEKLEEPYLPHGTPTYPEGSLSEQSLRCGKGQFIVLGDNRRNSTDSRSYGPVVRRDILGLILP